jgi:hypothetical protein
VGVQRKIFKEMQKDITMHHAQLAEVTSRTRDLPVLINQLKDNEYFIDRILPIQIQKTIFDSTAIAVDPYDKERLLELV